MEVSEQEGEVENALVDSLKPDRSLIPRLGILCIEIDAKMAKILPDLRQPDGLIVAAKSPEGQGRYIDLQVGDVIHTLNNQPVGSLKHFAPCRRRRPKLIAEPVALLVGRSGTFPLRHSLEIE